ncbi:MAG: transposase [Roseibacillus sp.]|nr:transposase [Roseibacillus sp.]MCP4850670.1 transposase [Actinomycetes bacterium]
MARRTEAEKRQILAAWGASGLGKAAFAKEHGLSPNSLYRWQKALKPSGFVEVLVPPARCPLFVHVGERTRIEVPEGFDASEVRRLVDTLC